MNGTGEQGQVTALIVNIQHFSTHDGPGIRTTVFLKGCSLRCQWCCNPESISARPELAYNPKLCIGDAACGRCLAICPRQALSVADADGRIGVDWNSCDDCGRCVAACPAQALHTFGRVMSVADVLAEIEQDEAFYRESAGGLTLSGGECLLQPDFCAALLKEAKARGIATAIETAGNVPWSSMERVLPFVDVMLHDYKLVDSGEYRRWIGADNDRIEENFRRAYVGFPRVRFIARIPLLAGINDDETQIDAVLDRIASYSNVTELELLSYHGYGESKYGFIGRERAREEFAAPDADRIAHLREMASRGLAERRNPAFAFARRREAM